MSYPKPSRRSWAEPWKIKMVEPIRMTTRRLVHGEVNLAATTLNCTTAMSLDA